MLVRSRYLHLIPERDCFIAFSTLSGGMVKLLPEVAGALSSESAQVLCAVARDHPELLCMGAMVDENVDERDLVRVRIGQARFADHSPNITIVPTLACNFQCRYCDQPAEARAQTMNDQIAKAIVAYIGKRLDGVEQFSITWYGGEPLLLLERLLSMQEDFILMCAKRGIGLFTSVVTNGWLLDASTAKLLSDSGIRQVQVTLDGPPDIHNHRRSTRNGEHTFDRIVENVQAAREQLEVRLRVNVDGDNASHLPELLDLLGDYGLADKVYLAPVVCYEASQAGIKTPFQNGMAMGEVLASLVGQLSCDDVSVRLTPVPLPCTACREATYVFGPSGHVYRCWHELGHPDSAIDHVTERVGNPVKRLFWLNYDPLVYPECVECDVLPLCLGGCPEQRRKGIQPPMCCSPLRSHLHEFVRNYAARPSFTKAQSPGDT